MVTLIPVSYEDGVGDISLHPWDVIYATENSGLGGWSNAYSGRMLDHLGKRAHRLTVVDTTATLQPPGSDAVCLVSTPVIKSSEHGSYELMSTIIHGVSRQNWRMVLVTNFVVVSQERTNGNLAGVVRALKELDILKDQRTFYVFAVDARIYARFAGELFA